MCIHWLCLVAAEFHFKGGKRSDYVRETSTTTSIAAPQLHWCLLVARCSFVAGALVVAEDAAEELGEVLRGQVQEMRDDAAPP